MKQLLAIAGAVWCLFGDAESRKISQDSFASSLTTDHVRKESAEMAEIKAFEKKEEAEIEEIKDLQKKAMQLILGKLDRQSEGQQATIIASSPDPLTFRNGSARSKTSEMFENCKAPAPRSLHPALVATESHDAIQIEEQEHEEQDEDMNLTGRCNSYQSPAVWFRYYKEPTLWCCDTRTQDCNGCEREQKGRCTVREPAFVKLAGESLYAPCMDIPGWANSAGKTCAQISEKECSVKRSQGQSSREACCQCGGGIRSPTSFAYDDYLFVLGEDVKMYPKPRTATRYGVNDGCELAIHNLTIDGETGVVSYMKGRDKPKEPFKVSCKVTAFQLHHQIFTADIHVAVQELSFGASVLTFTPKTTLYELRKSASSEWKDFSTNCAPEAKWLKLEGNGNLKVVEGEETGVVDSIQDTFNGQVATVCQLWAYSKAKAQKDDEWKLKSMGVVVVKPTAAPLLSYPTQTLTAAVGQAVPPLEPVAFPQGVMVPSSYGMRCNKFSPWACTGYPSNKGSNREKCEAGNDQEGSEFIYRYNHDRHTAAHPVCGTKGCWCCRRPKNKFKFDAVHGIGFYDGHPLLELQSNGQLSLNTGPSFARVFDAMGSEQDGSVVKLELKCRIVGVFPDSDFKPLTSKMNIVITDTTCWVKEKIRCGQQPASKKVKNRAQCQHWCRSRPSCSAYVYDSRRRRKRCIETKRNSVGGRTCEVYTKIPDCNPETACVQVDARTWLERGTYCPVGYDVDRGSMTYLKEGLTPNEMIYLRKFKTGADSLVDGCDDGSWLLQQQSADDFQNKKKGLFEFAGPFVSCKVKSVSYTGLPCTQPSNITEEEDAVPRMILDNPDTKAPEDYWLHPCDCAPKVWGDAPPMDQEVFAALPPESPDQFIRSPVMIVEGQFVCPPNEMLGDGPIFETEDEAQEIGDCELKCKNMDECNFFWHGTQHALATCRLYTKCGHLVREPGVEGVLKAVPKIPACLVTAPEDCWTKTLRRVALTSNTVPSFWYWTLHAECDYMLLLGGWGINGCSRPSVRDMNSHKWQHKRHLPGTFKHGEMIQASCWSDRYEGINLGVKKREAITCVNGGWFASNGLNGFEGFDCLPCMQVGTAGFGDVHEKRQQELYYFNRLAMQLHSEVNPISDGKVSCLEPLTPPPEVTTDLPKGLKEAKSFDLGGYEFIEDDNVMGSDALWHSASRLSYSGMKVKGNFGSSRTRKRPLTATPNLGKCLFKEKKKKNKFGFSFDWASIKNKKWWQLTLKRTTWVTSLEFTVGGADCCKNGLKDIDIWAGGRKCARRITIGEGETKRVRCYAKTKKIKIDTGAFRSGADIQFCGIKVFGQTSEPKKAEIRKYFFQSLPEAQEACTKDHRCTMVSRDDGMSVDGSIRRYELRRGNKISWIGAKNWHKVKPIPCVGNCAGLKPVTCSAGMAGCAHRTATDGLKNNWRWSSSPHSVGGVTCEPVKEWVEVDLGADTQFDQVRLFGYANGRRYCGTSIGLTKDKITWTWPYWSTGWRNREWGAGTTFNIGLQTARYVRVYLGKNNQNAHIHLLEIEIYRKSIPAPPEPKSKWITTAHIGHLGTRVKCKYSLLQDAANISANATEEDFEMEEDVEDTEENLAAFQMETKEGARVVQEQAEEAEAGAEDASLEEAGEEEEEEDSEEEEEEEEAEDSEEGEENEPAEVEERTQRALLSKASRVKLRDSDEPDMLDEEEAYDGEEDYEEEEEEEDMGEMEDEESDDVAELEEGDVPTTKTEAANMTALSEEELEDQSAASRRRRRRRRRRRSGRSRRSRRKSKKLKIKIPKIKIPTVKKIVKKVKAVATRRRRSRRRRSRRRRSRRRRSRRRTTTTTSTTTTTTTTTCNYWIGVTGFGVDLTTHGTLKGGHVWASSHAKKIECRLWCDHVHVLTMRHASLGRHGTSAAIPAVCKGAKFLWLAGSASAGYCEFSWHKLEVYEFPKAITVPKSQEPDLGTEAYGCAANYRPQGAVTLDVQQYGFLAPGNQVSFSRRSRKTACKISCLGHSWKSINFNEGRSRSHRRRARDLPWWCTGASQIVLEGGGKCGGCHLKSHDMLVSPHPANNVKTGFPGKKIVAWFKSENAGRNWKSSVGDYWGKGNWGVKTYTARGYGAKSAIKFVQGSTSNTFEFKGVLRDHYTVCAVTRYTSAKNAKRILQGSLTNIVFGHHGAEGVGVVYFGGWQTPQKKRIKSTKWTTVCASPGSTSVIVDGQNVGTAKTDSFHNQDLVINRGKYGAEKSDFAVMEVITWNYILTKREMEEASTYLMKKLMVGGEKDMCRIALRNPSWNHREISSFRSEGFKNSELDSDRAWCANKDDRNPWVEIDMKDVKNVIGVVIQGLKEKDKENYVYSFKVSYTKDPKTGKWTQLPVSFTGLSGSPNDHVRAYFEAPVEGRVFKLHGFSVHGEMCLRAALMICQGKLENEMTLLQAKTCPTDYSLQSWKDSDISSRRLRIHDLDNQCVAVEPMEKNMALVYKKCEADDIHQLIPAHDIGYMFTMLHRNSWLQDNVLRPGLKAEYHYIDQGWSCDIPNILFRMPDKMVIISQLNYGGSGAAWTGLKSNDKFAARISGVLMVNEPGSYQFKVTANDAAAVYLSHKKFLQLTGCRSNAASKEGKQDLKMGSWPFEVYFYEKSGQEQLTLHWKPPGVKNWQVVPGSAFAHMADSTMWMPTSAVAKGCIGNTAMGGLNPGLFTMKDLSKGTKMDCRFIPLLSKDLPVTIKTNRTFQGFFSPWTCTDYPGKEGSDQEKCEAGNDQEGSEFIYQYNHDRNTADHPVCATKNCWCCRRPKASSVDGWPNWWEDLEQWEMGCPPGRVLQTVDFLNVSGVFHVKYICAASSGLGQCYPGWTDQKDAKEFSDTDLSRGVLSRLNIVCPGHDLLQSIHFEFSTGGLWGRFKYMCCREGGAPVVTLSHGQDRPAIHGSEGTYCPEKAGASGRMDYLQKAFGRWQTTSPSKLTFSEETGKWCIGGGCSAETDALDPAGLKLGGFEVTMADDFDGEFKAKGVAPPGGGVFGPGDVPEVKPPPPPSRPKAPAKPKMEKFVAEQPKYSDKCVNYGDLWKKVQETTTNEAGETEANANELGTEEESAAGAKDMHPCDLAKSFGGFASVLGGGDGRAIPRPLTYDSLKGCFDRRGKIGKWAAMAQDAEGVFTKGTGLSNAMQNTLCVGLPNVVIAPMGAGTEIKAGEVCKSAISIWWAKLMMKRNYAYFTWKHAIMNPEKARDCKPYRATFARMFCDLHCVRDAVIRGDRTILRNLQKATDVTNGNTEKLAGWIVKTAQLDAGWLGEKMDHQSLVQGIENKKEFTAIREMIEGGDKKELFLAINQRTKQMQSELAGYAEGASFSQAATLAANDALEKFAADSKSSIRDGNSTEHALKAFNSLVTLRSKLRSVADKHSKADTVAMSVVEGARQMQESLKLQRETLGIYRKRSNATRQMFRSRSGAEQRERHAMLLDLDRVWWKIRGALDDYIDEAEDEIRGYDSGVHALTQYEKCSVDFQSLLAVYKQTMAASDRSHRALKTTWRHVSNLLGELASHIVDGEAFDTFLQQEGCEGSVADGGLTEQTLQQVRDASAGMRMLYDRFEVADLASPDLKTVEDAVERIKASFSEATERVCKIRGEIPNWFLPHIDLEKDQKQMDSEIALLEEAR